MNIPTPMLILAVLIGLALLYFLVGCHHKYRVTASNKDRDVLQCRKCSKVKARRRSKFRKLYTCTFIWLMGFFLLGAMQLMFRVGEHPFFVVVPMLSSLACFMLAIHIFHKANIKKP